MAVVDPVPDSRVACLIVYKWECSVENAIRPSYETRLSCEQTIADIFNGSWKSALPGGIVSGSSPMFADRRPGWFSTVLPGGFTFKSVLELGPFEGYQTMLIERLGAKFIDSVEGNNINFLKCLCIKELYGLKARFHLGDIFKEAKQERQYDVVWASGVLYHMQAPIEFIEAICKRANYIYIWTHYFDENIMQSATPEAMSMFLRQYDREVVHAGRAIHLHARSYNISTDYEHNIPMYWEGAPRDITFWLKLDDMYAIFENNGFNVSRVEYVGDLGGLPVASFAAVRKSVS